MMPVESSVIKLSTERPAVVSTCAAVSLDKTEPLRAVVYNFACTGGVAVQQSFSFYVSRCVELTHYLLTRAVC